MGPSEGTAAGGELVGFHVIEVGKNFGVDVVYSYPEVCDEARTVYVSKIMKMQRERGKGRSSGEVDGTCHRFLRYRDRWVYIHLSGRDESNNVVETGIIVESKDFYPGKYSEVAEGLLATYLREGLSTSPVLGVFLGLVVRGESAVPGRKTLLKMRTGDNGNLGVPYADCTREIIKYFGLETITIFTALTRKLRIIVFHHVAEDIYPYILSLPCLSPNESPLWNHFYPNVNMNDIELDYLKSLHCYVAGCADTGMEKRTDLYDVFVNLPAREVIAAPHAKDKLIMSKAHKKMAVFLTQLADSDDVAPEQLHSHIVAKSKQLFKDGY